MVIPNNVHYRREFPLGMGVSVFMEVRSAEDPDDQLAAEAVVEHLSRQDNLLMSLQRRAMNEWHERQRL